MGSDGKAATSDAGLTAAAEPSGPSDRPTARSARNATRAGEQGGAAEAGAAGAPDSSHHGNVSVNGTTPAGDDPAVMAVHPLVAQPEITAAAAAGVAAASAAGPVPTAPRAKRGLFAGGLPFLRRRPARTAAGAATAAAALQLVEAPAGTAGRAQRPRRAMKPLPWGRDFAAALVRREDTLTAIFGKLDAADSPRVALVAPRGSEELSRALGMRRLRRHVDMTGKDLMIVTRSGALRSRAREVGLAVVSNVKKVDFERYGRGGMRVGSVVVPLPGLGLLLRLALFMGALAALAAAVLLYLPRATVDVYPQTQTIANTVDATLSTDAPATVKPGADVPAHRRSQTLTRTVQYPVHGQATVKAPDGSDKQVAAATDDDIKQGTQFAQQVLLNQGRKALEDRYRDETLFQDSATVSALDTKANVKAGEATDLLEVTASGQVTMLSADKSVLRTVLEQSLPNKLDKNTSFIPDTFAATVLSAGAFDKTNNRLSVRVKLSEGVSRAVNVAVLRKALAGKNRHDAQQTVVENVDQSAPARIKVEPGWAPWLPRFTSRIDVNVRPAPTPQPAGSPAATPAATPKPQ